MKTDIFTFKDYKKFILSVLNERDDLNRSFIARELQVQSAYISQVLNGSAHLSMEQGYRLTETFSLGAPEKEFFMCLLQYNRAGTRDLELFFKERLQELLETHLNLTKRLKNSPTLSEEDRGVYYSSWIYGAVHMATLVPDLNNVPKIADYLELPISRVQSVIDFLLRTGLVKYERGNYKAGPTRLHLGSDSVYLAQMHHNYRQMAIERIQRIKQENISKHLMYSSIAVISKEDFYLIKDILLKSIQDSRDVIIPSKEEILCLMNVDLINLSKS
jgi:uncharacterized protein (TIGR02147 family)